MPANQNLILRYKAYITNVGWINISYLLSLCINLQLTSILARGLGPSNLGAFNTVLSINGFCFLLTTGGFGSLVNIYLSGPNVEASRDRRKSSVIASIAAAMFLQMVASLLLYCIIISTYRSAHPYFFLLAITMAPKLALSPLLIYKYTLQQRAEFRLIAIIEFAGLVLYYFYIKLAQFDGRFPLLIGLGLSLQFAITAVMFAIFQEKAKPVEWTQYSNKKTLLLAKANAPLTVSAVAVYLTLNIDNMILFAYCGPREAGIYTAAYKLLAFFFIIPTSIVSAISPRFCRVCDENGKAAKSIYQTISIVLFFFAVCIAVAVYQYSPLIVDYLYGSAYAEAVKHIRILIWAFVFVSLISIRTLYLSATKRLYRLVQMSLFGLTVNLVLLCITIFGLNLGATGASFACLLAFAANFACFFIFFPEESPIASILASKSK